MDEHHAKPRHQGGGNEAGNLRVPGCLTVPRLAAQLDVTAHWLYDRIHSGTIATARDGRTGLYLFPDHSETLNKLQKLRAGEIERLAFDMQTAPGGGHQDA